MPLGLCFTQCCNPPCDICEGNVVPASLFATFADWVDATCFCPSSSPVVVSPLSAMNGVHEALLVKEKSLPGIGNCYTWYEGEFDFGDLNVNGTDCLSPPAWDEYVRWIYGATVRFGIAITRTGSNRNIDLFTSYGTDPSGMFGLFNDGENWVTVYSDTTHENAWICSGDGEGESDPLPYDTAAGYYNIYAAPEGVTDPDQSFSVWGPFSNPPFGDTNAAPCGSSRPPAGGTVVVSASATLVSLAP